MTPILELTDVVKRFGSGATEIRAVSDLSLTVDPGEMVALRGPSGCGKSTVLHLAGGLEDPNAGLVRVDGRDLADLDARGRAALRRTTVGFVFQRLNLVPGLTALENVMLPLELGGVPTRAARGEARAALAAMGLDGERRLVLADEPTGALDSVTGDAVIELLAGLPQERGTAVVLVTHEPRYAAWADRVVSLRDGKIVGESVSPDAQLAAVR